MSDTRRSMLGGLIALVATLATATASAQSVAPDATPPPAEDELSAQAPSAPAPAPAPRTQSPASAPAAMAPAPQMPQPRMAAPGSYVAERAPRHAYRYAPTSGRNRRIMGYRDIRRNPPEIWGTGLGLFLAGYVLDFAILTPIANAISNDRDGADEEDAWAWSLIPIAGPIIQLGVGAPHPAIPIATGLMQIGGLVTFIIGLTSQETASIPIYEGSEGDPNMLRIGLDAAQVDGGGELRLTVTHL